MKALGESKASFIIREETQGKGEIAFSGAALRSLDRAPIPALGHTPARIACQADTCDEFTDKQKRVTVSLDDPFSQW